MLVDTHCHLDAAEFDADRDAVAQAAQFAGVGAIVVPAVERSNFGAVASVCRSYPGCHAAYGIHPMYVDRARDEDLDILGETLRREQPVAVGEIGIGAQGERCPLLAERPAHLAQVVERARNRHLLEQHGSSAEADFEQTVLDALQPHQGVDVLSVQRGERLLVDAVRSHGKSAEGQDAGKRESGQRQQAALHRKLDRHGIPPHRERDEATTPDSPTAWAGPCSTIPGSRRGTS